MRDAQSSTPEIFISHNLNGLSCKSQKFSPPVASVTSSYRSFQISLLRNRIAIAFKIDISLEVSYYLVNSPDLPRQKTGSGDYLERSIWSLHGDFYINRK